MSATKTYVLVHGAWHGGWCWRDVAAALRADGHNVTTPTQTGVGERAHLLSRDITIETFVADIVNHIEAEDLNDVILVGHSFGGVSITGAADRIPQRIRHLVYLDGAIIESGKTMFDTLPRDMVAARRRQIAQEGQGFFMPPPAPTAFGIPQDHPLTGWVKHHLTPHPVGTYESTVRLGNPIGNGRPRTYIACTSPPHAAAASPRQWVAEQSDWNRLELATGHDAMVLAPSAVVSLLDAVS